MSFSKGRKGPKRPKSCITIKLSGNNPTISAVRGLTTYHIADLSSGWFFASDPNSARVVRQTQFLAKLQLVGVS